MVRYIKFKEGHREKSNNKIQRERNAYASKKDTVSAYDFFNRHYPQVLV
jgi:hypothetical protein